MRHKFHKMLRKGVLSCHSGISPKEDPAKTEFRRKETADKQRRDQTAQKNLQVHDKVKTPDGLVGEVEFVDKVRGSVRVKIEGGSRREPYSASVLTKI